MDISRGWLLESLDSVDLDPGGHHLLLLSILPIGEQGPLRLELRLIQLCTIHLVALTHCEGGDIGEARDRGVQILHVFISRHDPMRVVLILLLVLRVVVIAIHFLNFNKL